FAVVQDAGASGTARQASEGQAVRDDEPLDQLPEAVPLHRIAPWWRLLAVFAIIAIVGLLALVLVLAIALVQMGDSQRFAAMTAATVPPSVVFASPAGGGVGSPDDAQADPQNLPYPVEADLAEADPYAPVDDKLPTREAAT